MNTLTYLLTPWCRVLLEKLTDLQLVKKIRRISRNPKVHYRTHNRQPPVSILGQSNPVHIPTSHLLKIRPNIVYSSTPYLVPPRSEYSPQHHVLIHPQLPFLPLCQRLFTKPSSNIGKACGIQYIRKVIGSSLLSGQNGSVFFCLDQQYRNIFPVIHNNFVYFASQCFPQNVNLRRLN